jgi:hypothetical protein
VADLPDAIRETWDRLPPWAWVSRRKEPLEALIRARQDRAAADAALRESDAALTRAVSAAWHAGNSWRTIGVVLGVSRQAAYRRYGPATHGPSHSRRD